MDPSQPITPESLVSTGPEFDPRLQPTPDYGTLGPGSDATGFETGSKPTLDPRKAARVASIIAALSGMFAALVAGVIVRTHSGPQHRYLAGEEGKPASAKDLLDLDRMKPQRQAETLLQLAVAQNQEAPGQISARVDGWQGQLQWNSQMASLTTAALDSSDMRVRESGVEVELAAYGLTKNSTGLQYVLSLSNSTNHEQKIWALWALGLLANRGVEPDKAVDVLISHLTDSDQDSRRWAVEAMALSGSDRTIEPLLKAMHDDAAPLVRERAACGLAQSGLFTPEQRMSAVPQLLNYSDDPSLDAQTHAWAFHALSDITQQHLPNDSATWRSWYENRNAQ